MASFDENGKYIKTNWKAGDKITATKLNKIEESIEAVNDNDISRHVEADARLDALEAKDVAHDKEFTNVKNTIANNKAAAELGDYEINSRMQFLEDELNDGIEEVHNVAETVDGKIAQGKADMEAMVAEVEADLEGLHAKNEELSEQLVNIENLSNEIYTATFLSSKSIEEILNERGVVVLKPGIYDLDDTITIEGKSIIITSSESSAMTYSEEDETLKQVILRVNDDKEVLKLSNCNGSKLKNVIFTKKTKTENSDTVYIENSYNMIIEKCGFHKGFNGLKMESSGVAKINNCDFSNNTNGLFLRYTGDSDINGCYFNTNNPDSTTSTFTDGAGLIIMEGNNTNIRGGKIEWNKNGLVICASNGINVNGINFDYNGNNHISLIQYNNTDNEMYSLKSININNNRFLGCNDIFDTSAHIHIETYDNATININNNSFNSSGPYAYDSCGGNTANNHLIGPKRIFYFINKGDGTRADINMYGNITKRGYTMKMFDVYNSNDNQIFNLNISEIDGDYYTNLKGVININSVNDTIVKYANIAHNGLTIKAVETKHFVELCITGTSTSYFKGDVSINGVDLTCKGGIKSLSSMSIDNVIIETRNYNTIFVEYNDGQILNKTVFYSKY